MQLLQKVKKGAFAALVVLTLLILSGCGHKLVAHSGSNTVDVYPDKMAFDQIRLLKNRPGPAGVIAGAGANLVAIKVPAATPVKVLASDEQGYSIEVLDGPDKGLHGYVAKDDVS